LTHYEHVVRNTWFKHMLKSAKAMRLEKAIVNTEYDLKKI